MGLCIVSCIVPAEQKATMGLGMSLRSPHSVDNETPSTRVTISYSIGKDIHQSPGSMQAIDNPIVLRSVGLPGYHQTKQSGGPMLNFLICVTSKTTSSKSICLASPLGFTYPFYTFRSRFNRSYDSQSFKLMQTE